MGGEGEREERGGRRGRGCVMREGGRVFVIKRKREGERDSVRMRECEGASAVRDGERNSEMMRKGEGDRSDDEREGKRERDSVMRVTQRER